jgi:lipoprotein-anchoring transpeptidase ErfK/SrfK
VLAPTLSEPPSINHVLYGRRPGSPPATAITPPAATSPGSGSSTSANATPAAPSTTTTALVPPAPGAQPTVSTGAPGTPPSVPAAAPPPAAGSPGAPAAQAFDGMSLYLSDSELATSSSYNWSVTASKSHHEMQVFYKRRLYKTYHAVFGRSRFAGTKQWEGDRRTPEGNYLIVSKHRSARFRWCLKINYPNAVDTANFTRLEAVGDIPRGMHEGGSIGIHGTDLPILNSGNVDWTTGCISVYNADISELAQLLPLGTLVVIKP